MESKLIRERFLEFFASKGHEIVPSAPMVIKNDPTLMFNNAGMNPFKDLFLGNSPVVHSRIADTQKCLRVSGKHNDLEEVGVDTYHHTMFEMLGNWSFGDYFKQEAIDWAWELLTEVYGLDKDRLYVTVFEGDASDGLEADEEAKGIWAKWVPEDRILLASKKDNFWEMGESGPCGPCSEIHIDLRGDTERAATSGASLVNADHPQVVEIWNLVFMQFNRMADGSLVPLPNKHIDTGMGFERLAMAMQGKQSNYDTDVFQPLLDRVATLSGTTYGRTDSKADVAFRVISDHIRAVAFSIADGQLPSNTGAGYVIRRILRRAIRYGYSFLDLNEPFMHALVPTLAGQMGDAFPELKAQQQLIERVILEEEESFLRTLAKGIERLEARLDEFKSTKVLPGDVVFELYDTFGFPVDLTALMAGEQGVDVDEAGFETAMEATKARSRAAGKLSTDDWVQVHDDSETTFVGYDAREAECRILRYREVKAKNKQFYQVVLDTTPFYPEGGGQVGDAGTLTAPGGSVAVFDTKKENNLIVHFVNELPADINATFMAQVKGSRRDNTQRNHTATHLVHEALREVLGTHVEQKGSLVKAESLRFDFSHFSKVTDEELAEVEATVNAKILANHPLVEHRAISMEEAKASGAMMLFGEKYGDEVRMIEFDSSKELCGGTHAPATGALGSFRITQETAVASGIRRIEAITGSEALQAMNTERTALQTIKTLLKAPANIEKAIEDLITKHTSLQKELDAVKQKEAAAAKSDLASNLDTINGINTFIGEMPLDAGAIKDIAFQLKNEKAPFFGVFGSQVGGKVTLTVAISDDLVSGKDLHAGNIVRNLAKHIQGGGGGQPFFATAGGKNPDGLGAAFEEAKGLL
ncbi:MAG: alanine--tRNA ligase [Crocinitomicaceae bacterium TMED209]|nr:MAG: alanine--tRNA ligase [Crocinitomicaceae bacterium TMED209]